MAKKFPINPARPERTCWGCDRYCAADAMICGNGTERTQHPVELFGPGWEGFGLDPVDGNGRVDAVLQTDSGRAATLGHDLAKP